MWTKRDGEMGDTSEPFRLEFRGFPIMQDPHAMGRFFHLPCESRAGCFSERSMKFHARHHKQCKGNTTN